MRQTTSYLTIITVASLLNACTLPQISKEPPKPTVPAVKTIKKHITPKKLIPISKVKPKKIPKICGLEIEKKQRRPKSEQYYLKANRLFAKDAIKATKKNLKKAICLNPKHAKAKELLQLLQQTYP